MNRCELYEKIMQDVLDAAASDRDRARLDHHMAQCPACRHAYRSLAFSLDLLAAAPVPSPGPDFTARTVQGAFRAGAVQARRRKYLSWCLAGLMALFSTLLVAGWASVVGPVARAGLRGLLGIFRDVLILCTVFDKLQTVLVDIMSLAGNAALNIALGVGAPVFWGGLTVLCLTLFIFIRSGVRLPDILVKRR